MLGKKLLITGGTGSFGNTVLQAFLGSDIAEIVVLSRDEEKQDRMRRQYASSKVRYVIGDVRDLERMRRVTRGVDFVFHAAALKQVPSCEFHPMEAVKTNILGTENVLDACIENGVRKVVCLSTDKAALPVNAMGMSKAIMEKVAIAKARESSGADTTISVTRYGNVLSSRGSVVPLFIQQIREGRPLTVTNPTMTRFLMTLEEAMGLVLFAFEHAKGGEIFVQKAGAASIGTLADAVRELFDYRREAVVIGSRHGEKLHEVLMTQEEAERATEMGQYFRIEPDFRNLQYESYLNVGNPRIDNLSEYSSKSAEQMSREQIKHKLLLVPSIREVLGC